MGPGPSSFTLGDMKLSSIPLVISPSTVVFPSDWTWELMHGLVKQAQFCVSFIALWPQNRSLMPSQATTVPGTLLAITRQLLQLERCSNPPPIQLVFWFRLKKKFFAVLWTSREDVTRGGVLAFLWPTLPGPRRQSNEPIFWFKLFL